MSIENQLTELTAAIKENTAVLRDVLAASSNAAPAPAPAPEPAKRTRAKAEPAPAPVEESPDLEASTASNEGGGSDESPEIDPPNEPEPETTTRVPAKSTKGDTPHVPAPTTPGQPAAGEFVDVDEVIAEIQKTVTAKLMEGDTTALKEKWASIRKGYGVDRISELRGQPAKLVEALAKAKAL